MRSVLKSKIHRAYVTENNPDYIGSIVIDEALMELVDLWPHEKVLVSNITNGNRWETYAIPGKSHAGIVSVQGAAARLCERGDCIIVMGFELTDVPITPKVILVDEQNQFVRFLGGAENAISSERA